MIAVKRPSSPPLRPGRRGRLVLVLALGAVLAGCAPGQSPSERALAAVEKSWADLRGRVREVAPDRAEEIDLALVRARASASEGDWLGMLAAVQGLPAQIEALSAEIERRERERDAQWDRANASLAEALPRVDAGIEKIAAHTHLPPGVSRADVADARVELQAARIAWTHAVSARGERRWDEAMNRAGEARLRARRALDAVGLPPMADLESHREADPTRSATR